MFVQYSLKVSSHARWVAPTWMKISFQKKKKNPSMFQWVMTKKAKLQWLHSSSSPCNKPPPSDDELTKPTCLNLRCLLEKSGASRRLKQWKQSVEIMAFETQTYKPPTCRHIVSLSQASPVNTGSCLLERAKMFDQTAPWWPWKKIWRRKQAQLHSTICFAPQTIWLYPTYVAVLS